MKTKLAFPLAALATALAAPVVADQISLESAPPVVVRTVPVAGAIDVDPALTEIRVTFSKAMQDGSWSWSTWGEENYPKTTGEAKYLADGRTCVLPVKLQPGKFYAIWLNSDRFHNFRDAGGQAAVPYLLSFRTRDGASSAATGFGAVTEGMLPSPRKRQAELLDLDTDRHATHERFGENDRETHAWIRDERLDVMGVVERGQIAVMFFDVVVAPAPSNSFLSLVPEQVITNWHLAQGEPNKITTVSTAQEQTDTFFYRTRENGRGVFQVLGPVEGGRGVKVRYRRLNDGAPQTSAIAPSPTLTPPVNDAKLNDDQRTVLAWTDRQFRSFFDARTFQGLSDAERAKLEQELIDTLNGPQTREYYLAINTLAALRSKKALPKLRSIAFERVDRNNRDRWMCIRTLGLMGDTESVPELIHLVYHGNQNTHWWAQISLVRLTGQNFAKDWNAWGKWWNEQNGQPPFKPEIIRWWDGQPEPDKLAESLEEGDRKFLESLKPKPSG